jgi:hypothetical protein
MQVILLPKNIDDQVVDQIASALGPWPPTEPLLLDAHATEWASPPAFVGLLTLGQALSEVGATKPRLTLPSPDVASYWAKAGFIAHADQLFELHGKAPRRRADEASDMLLPVTPIRDMDDVHATIGRIGQQAATMLKDELGLEASVVGGFSTSLSEVCQNIIEHSGTTGWVASHVYNYRRRLGRKVAVIAVSDAGIGFRRSLEASQAKRFGDRWDDATALETALIHSISRFRDPGRGQGLAGTKRYLARWQGKIAIRSGTARVAIVPPWDDAPPMTTGLAWFPGAQVTLEVPGKEAT